MDLRSFQLFSSDLGCIFLRQHFLFQQISSNILFVSGQKGKGDKLRLKHNRIEDEEGRLWGK